MPSVELHHADCLDVFIKPVSLIYLDPPYGHRKIDEYYGVGDTFEEYLHFMYVRLTHLKSQLLPDANVVIHVDYRSVHYLRVMADRIFGYDNFRNEIIWGFSGPSIARNHLPRKHQNLLWYGLGDYPFNQVRVPYTKRLSNAGKKSWSGKDLDVDAYMARGKLLESWWTDIPALQRNEKEKTGWRTQKPLKLLQRIVGMFSNPEQRVYDPFMGSGTTLEAALTLGRSAVGCDRDPVAVELARTRVERNRLSGRPGL